MSLDEYFQRAAVVEYIERALTGPLRGLRLADPQWLRSEDVAAMPDPKFQPGTRYLTTMTFPILR